ncbi:antitoxin Xre/MbcA/ParS toxin-binding domain-containing protein [Brevundimonas sp.]|jgi:putative toxin-antitoxin system antitoxin component (TIGR02293 family)|uniref:antitoxin Xre/MbcA/ParS toxin-binding domain-containing protein n=1 Tax=Brevundimonas sp. TaxID=1871086 RepID=UPI002E155804|nr:antitoxin Xre/MbcA/ParS toxin-binding domain-containing protein [Brevundimonas sp.]
MTALDIYSEPQTLPSGDAARIGRLLGLDDGPALNDVTLADRVASGLRPASAAALGDVIGMPQVIGRVIPEATLRRARKARKPLSREMSERLYEVGRVVDAVGRAYHGDAALVSRFLGDPHPLLGGRTPLDMARSSSAGADAVINLVRRASAGFAV